MKKYLLINPAAEKAKIIIFLKATLQKTGFKNLVIGVSGGIDSATSLYLAAKAIPPQNIFIAHLYYFNSNHLSLIRQMCQTLNIPSQNQYLLSIQKPVDTVVDMLKISNLSDHGRVRIGNIMARIRMIALFDLAKRHKALVLGTENKSEHLLGYFTRFGDAASDIEPITHLYKTQVYQLAKSLNIPSEILTAKPTAGLWSNQTDEGEFGFSYLEADLVLHQYFNLKIPLAKIKSPNAKKIINFSLKNHFKHQVPYSISNKSNFSN